MEYSVRRFARNILLLHLVLLVVVLGIVLIASREIDRGARAQALGQAQKRQEQLASMTSRGIEGFYQNIISDMDLLPRNDDSRVEPNLLPELSKAAKQSPLGQRGVLVGFLLARQLEDRVSHLFVFDKDTMLPHGLLREDLEEELKLGKVVPPPPTTRPFAMTRPIGPKPNKAGPGVQHPPKMLRASGPVPTKAELEVVERNREWLECVDAQSISRFEVFDSGGLNLVAIPLGPEKRLLVVAAVPVEKINEKYLARLNSDRTTGAFLIDESMTAMAASRPGLVGMDFDAAGDATIKQLLTDFKEGGYCAMSRPIAHFKVGEHQFEPAIVTIEPIEVVPGRKWFLMVASPMSEVDRIVSGVFTRVVWWAVFVTIAVTGILVSTATQLIRGRAKLQRVRMDVLRKELERARQIQQAWLPRIAPASSALDVAAVNYPAQHISGDFYNWFDLPDGRTVVAIGDVTGHGMSAAFLMATTQLLVRMTMQRITDPGRCLTEVNRQLCAQVFNGQFVTMLLMVMDPESGTIELCSAGHPAPLLAQGRGAGSLVPLPIESHLVLGVEPDTAYQTERLDLGAGATLLLYTDGASDVTSPDGSRFGSDGLKQAAGARGKEGKPLDARGLVEAVVHAVNRFRGRQELGDDLTLVAVRVTVPAKTREPEPAAALP